MALTLFVGSNESTLAKEAQSANPSAYLINSDNYNQQHNGVCYTSISDLETLGDFASLLRQADTIIYVSAPSWTKDQKIKKYSERYWVEEYLYLFSLDPSKKIINAPIGYSPSNIDLMLSLNDQRKNNKKHLWVSGCSTSYGLYVHTNERYANLLAEKLNIPLSMLAKKGASNPYAADQILRSNIRKNDVVVWGITSHRRATSYDDERADLLHQGLGSPTKKIDFLSPTLLYASVISVHQVLNFCHKIGAKIILLGIHLDSEFACYLKDIPEYVHANGFYGADTKDLYIDLAEDNLHPGPLMHQWYSEKILNKLKEIE